MCSIRCTKQEDIEMKRALSGALCAVLLGLTFCVVPSLYAQSEESEFYYVTVPIERIYAHRDGYMVTYRKDSRNIASTYIPIEWFSDLTGKADLVAIGSGSTWPRMTIYYKSGDFSHVRLIVRRDRRHGSWGVIPFNVDISDRFQGVEEIHLEY